MSRPRVGSGFMTLCAPAGPARKRTRSPAPRACARASGVRTTTVPSTTSSHFLVVAPSAGREMSSFAGVRGRSTNIEEVGGAERLRHVDAGWGSSARHEVRLCPFGDHGRMASDEGGCFVRRGAATASRRIPCASTAATASTASARPVARSSSTPLIEARPRGAARGRAARPCHVPRDDGDDQRHLPLPHLPGRALTASYGWPAVLLRPSRHARRSRAVAPDVHIYTRSKLAVGHASRVGARVRRVLRLGRRYGPPRVSSGSRRSRLGDRESRVRPRLRHARAAAARRAGRALA